MDREERKGGLADCQRDVMAEETEEGVVVVGFAKTIPGEGGLDGGVWRGREGGERYDGRECLPS